MGSPAILAYAALCLVACVVYGALPADGKQATTTQRSAPPSTASTVQAQPTASTTSSPVVLTNTVASLAGRQWLVTQSPQAPVVITVPGVTVTTTVPTVATYTVTQVHSPPPTIYFPPFSTYFPPVTTMYAPKTTTTYMVITSVIPTVNTVAVYTTPPSTTSFVTSDVFQSTVQSSIISQVPPQTTITAVYPTTVSQPEPQTTHIVSSIPTVTSVSVVTGPTTAPAPTPISTPTVTGQCAPNCNITVRNNCQNNLAEAVRTVSNGGTISLAHGTVLTEEVETTKSIYFAGCGVGRARITVNMNRTHGGVIIAKGNNQKIGFYNLAVEGAGMTKFSSMLRTPDLGDDAHIKQVNTGPVSLFVDNCEFKNFRTQARGGSVIFIGRVGDVSITNSEFSNNNCAVMNGKLRWDGGGAVWLVYFRGNGMVRNTTFRGNSHDFGHSVGSALMVMDMNNRTRFDLIDCLFERNKADSGGAIYFRDLRRNSILNIDSTFINNECVYSEAYGCRGGAAWIQNIHGDVYLKGTYSGNTAIGDRGAVVANNRIHRHGRTVISGTFTNNRCTKGATVWDSLYAFGTGGQLTVLTSSVFSGNVGENNRDIILRLLGDKEEVENRRSIVRTETQWYASGKQWNFVGGLANPTGAVEYRVLAVDGVVIPA